MLDPHLGADALTARSRVTPQPLGVAGSGVQGDQPAATASRPSQSPPAFVLPQPAGATTMVNGTSRPSQCRSKQQLANMTHGPARSDKSVSREHDLVLTPGHVGRPLPGQPAPHPPGRASIPVTPETKA